MFYFAWYEPARAVNRCLVYLDSGHIFRSCNGLIECYFQRLWRWGYSAAFHLVLLFLFPLSSFALTPAATVVESTSTVTFDINGIPNSSTTTIQFLVQEIIDVSVSWSDSTNVIVTSPDNAQLSSFSLRNDGNGNETFALTVDNIATGSDQFDFDLTTSVSIYIENGVSPGYQAGDDTLYAPGVNDPVVAAESVLDIYLVVDIPAGQTIGDLGQIQLNVLSASVDGSGTAAAGSPPGTTLLGVGDGSTDAIVGSSRAQGSAVATYEVADERVTVLKEIVGVSDPFGGSLFMTGSQVTYRISVSGRETETLTVVDPIPINTSYVPNSITLNGVAKTDSASDDEADFNNTQANTVTVEVANVAGSSASIIEFSVTID